MTDDDRRRETNSDLRRSIQQIRLYGKEREKRDGYFATRANIISFPTSPTVKTHLLHYMTTDRHAMDILQLVPTSSHSHRLPP